MIFKFFYIEPEGFDRFFKRNKIKKNIGKQKKYSIFFSNFTIHLTPRLIVEPTNQRSAFAEDASKIVITTSNFNPVCNLTPTNSTQGFKYQNKNNTFPPILQ